jgi:ribonuclease HI
MSEGTNMATIDLLNEYAEGDVGNSEQTLARVAARWIAAEPAAATDPLLQDLLGRARFHKATHGGADSFLFAPMAALAPTRKSNILDYFGVRNPVVSVLEQMPVALTATAATSTATTAATATKRYRIYCDGACQGNGRKGARAGYGAVLISPDGEEVERISKALEAGETQTNQRAELRALQWAFGKALSLPEGAEIHTDSEYAMKCFTEWGPLWAAKGWRKSTGGEVLHQDILRPMWEIWKSRGNRIRLHHVAAHTGGRDIHSVGNAKADALAVASISTKY